jgi:hypothetical protein
MLTIITLAIGADYKKGLKKALESKRKYAEKHGYKYIEASEEAWDRTRPVAWSKVILLLKILQELPKGELVWLSDADVLITNMDLKVEEHVLPLLPPEKDLLFIYDACHHLNSGNLLMRNSEWLRDYWTRVNQRTEFTYHIWWENMAMIKIMEENKEDQMKIQVTNQHKRFNAYIMGLPNEPLWEQGDFLVHFAGIYKPEKMEGLINEILLGNTPRLSLS